MAGRPRKWETPQELEEAIENFFFPPTGGERGKVTIAGLAYNLGFESRQSFYDYEEIPEFSYIIKRARLRVETAYEEKLSEGSCTGAIFALKNMGWKDKTESEINGNLGVTWVENKTYLNGSNS